MRLVIPTSRLVSMRVEVGFASARVHARMRWWVPVYVSAVTLIARMLAALHIPVTIEVR
ncbi:MAG TPA: hypothetical protein VLS93_09710 [Anaeromyxobacteraceae bacterium]|nr:hypothetical protein [Anaeromyxobacteraceae bacterium]